MGTRSFKATQAVREKIWTKVALMSPSGGGKTYTGLTLATGMKKELEKITGKEARILMANSEGARGRYYANEFSYDIVELTSPFSPELYVDLIDYAVEEGYSILLIDGTSPEWEGNGGCLDLHARAGGQYRDWSKVTPRHDKFIASIAYSPIHIIATMRGKDQYEMEKDNNGKIAVRKFGVGAKQREGFEYEFTATFLLDQNTHFAAVQKDNTHLFEGEADRKLTVKDGENIIKWANSGKAKNTTAKKIINKDIVGTGEGVVTEEQNLYDLISQIKNVVELAKEKEVDKAQISKIIKKHHIVSGKPTANYNSIKDSEIAKLVLDDLKNKLF